MVDAGHRPPVFVQTLQIVLVHGTVYFWVEEVGEGDAERVLVVWQGNFLGIVESLVHDTFHLLVVHGDAIDGHIGDGNFQRSVLVVFGWLRLDEKKAILGTERQGAIR